MADRRSPGSDSPSSFIVLGLIFSAIGGGLLAADGEAATIVGLVLITLGDIFVTIGCVAVGMVMALARHEYLRKQIGD